MFEGKIGVFARYEDVDGNAIGYRTLSGNGPSANGVLHARQRKNEKPLYTQRPAAQAARKLQPHRRIAAVSALVEAHEKGEVLTGVSHAGTKMPSFDDMLNVADGPLGTPPESRVRPAKAVLDEAMRGLM